MLSRMDQNQKGKPRQSFVPGGQNFKMDLSSGVDKINESVELDQIELQDPNL